jgi:hypothetical protein
MAGMLGFSGWCGKTLFLQSRKDGITIENGIPIVFQTLKG